MRKIDIAIPYYNRADLIEETISAIHNDERISQIVITDDCSKLDDYNRLMVISSKYPKVVVFRNEKNLGMFYNKAQAVINCTSEYCILLDSDNVIDESYVDAIYRHTWSPRIILCPDFAKPNFDYREFSGLYFYKNNVAQYLDNGRFLCSLNTCNYFVNRSEYLSVYYSFGGVFKFGGADSI